MTAIGVIGEDDTDCETIRILIQRIANRPIGVKTKYPPSGGCGGVKNRSHLFMKDLLTRGCNFIVIVHDLDHNSLSHELNDESRLRQLLSKISVPAGVQRHICIPVEEIEAWFWSDNEIIARIGKGHGRALESPDKLRSPKEALKKLSEKAHRRPPYSTNDNPKLAMTLDLDLCAKRCRAFAELRAFVHAAVAALPSGARTA